MYRTSFRPLVLLVLLTLLAPCGLSPSVAAAQEAATEGLQSPGAFLGYPLGSRFTPHHRVVDYVRHVAQHSPRVQVEPYGTTYEGRPLMVAFVARPDRIENLDAVRRANLQRTGLEAGTPPADAPAVVWLSYNVHGNESVSTEAAMQTLYTLADPQEARAADWLEDVVVAIDPAVNPDGRDRYVHWYQQTRGMQPNAAPAAREHDEPWPGGRTNHYYFDLNRDWAWGVQAETRQRLALYNRWLPQVHVDFHEQSVDAPYYFAPAARPFHADITDWQRDFQTTIGRNNARYFDDEGWLYFTREVFDLLYPGYGDTWPTFNGAIGMTYEQGGSGRAGLAIETAAGDTLTLRDRIDHHYTTGLSTVEATAQNRARVLEEFGRHYAASRAGEESYRTYVVKGGDNPDRLAALAGLLDLQGIRYGYTASEAGARGFHYGSGATQRLTVEAGDLVVPAAQPKGTLARVLFEPRTALADSLTYDITAWALPYAYGLDAYALEDALDAGTGAAPAARHGARGASGTAYAYVAEWKSLADARLLAALLKRGVKARAVQEPFTTDGRTYGHGSVVLTRADNEALGNRFDAVVRAVADSLGQPVDALASGFSTAGPDLGSSSVAFLGTPRVALLAGPPASSYSVGQVWHFFDEQLSYPVTLLPPDELDDAVLRDVDVLVLPDGYYGDDLRERLEDLAGWVRAGGRVVALEGALRLLADLDGFAIAAKDAAEDTSEAAPADLLRTYAERERESARDNVPGAIFRARMDATHPLGYGYGEAYHTLKVGDAAYAFLEDGWNVAALEEDALVSGFAGAEAQEKLQNSLVFGVQPMGRGAAVYLVDDPLFRGFWQGGKLLFANAVFMVGAR